MVCRSSKPWQLRPLPFRISDTNVIKVVLPLVDIPSIITIRLLLMDKLYQSIMKFIRSDYWWIAVAQRLFVEPFMVRGGSCQVVLALKKNRL